MRFEVYCDETLPDLLTSQRPRARYLMIGSLWLDAEIRKDAKERITALRHRHAVWGEMKWTKISSSKQAFYEELIDVFISFGQDMRFRCIAVDRERVNLSFHNHDGELGYYKFYYQLLRPWIQGSNEYRILFDLKTNRRRDRLSDLKHYLRLSNQLTTITDIQSLPAREVDLLQLCDVLLGAASSRLNRTGRGERTAKETFVKKLEERLKVHGQLGPTLSTEKKFNIFKFQLAGSCDAFAALASSAR